jgi:hypothetical protein
VGTKSEVTGQPEAIPKWVKILQAALADLASNTKKKFIKSRGHKWVWSCCILIN